ncbi:MAG TPA: hypothetical protein VES42_15930 [Pilimelia sp.]|nr:hypothetical protein [Pilimelia sp.]
MSSDVDAPGVAAEPRATPPWRNRWVWLAALTILAAGALFAAYSGGVIGDRRPAGAAGLPDGFRAQLAARAVAVLEQTPTQRHEGHALHSTREGAAEAELLCAVRVFGVDPPEAGALPEVRRVYGYHICALAERGRPWDFAVKLTGPLVVGLADDPPTVKVAEGGVGFAERVAALMPERYRAEARNESLTPAAMTELRSRYDDAADL